MTEPTPAELRELLLAWGEPDGAPLARAAMHLLVFVSLTSTTPGLARHVRVDHVRTPKGLVRCAWIEDWDELLADQELILAGAERRMIRLAASLDSWVTADGLDRCFQLMETDDPALLDAWLANWADITEFEVHPVIKSAEAAARVNER